jgi:hypothetical protein
MSYSDEVKKEIDRGINGDVTCIPIAHKKLGEHININQGMYTLLGGSAGSGKTSFTDYTYVLQAYKWFKEQKEKGETDIDLEIIYRSMERPRAYKIGKWLCMKLFQDYGILMDVPTIFGWGVKKNHVSQEIYEKIVETLDYFDEMSDVVKIIDGAENPTGVFKQLEQTAKDNGTLIINEFDRTYKANNDKKITLVVLDHIGKVKKERGFSKKETIDKMSEYLGISRDLYKFSPIVVSQFNRSLSDSQRARNKEITPDPDDFKDSGNLYEDCDVALALFNPYKYKVFDHMEYEIDKFVNNKGYNRFRSISALKNSYGVDDVRYGYGFIGEIGMFHELPKADDMSDAYYENVRSVGGLLK